MMVDRSASSDDARPDDISVPGDAGGDGNRVAPQSDRATLQRREFLTFLVAAPVLTIGGRWMLDRSGPTTAHAQVPGPTVSDFWDLGDALVTASAPTMPLLTLEVTEDNRATFALPRMEVGQGIVTCVAMMIAEELSFPLDRVDVTLADSRPELMFNQLTGGSYNTRALYQPVSKMAAAARERIRQAAAEQWGVSIGQVTVADGSVFGPNGESATLGSLSQLAASLSRPLDPAPKPVSQHTLLGRKRSQVDARAMVTGQKRYTLDLEVPGAMPTVAVHAPQIKGTLASLDNEAELRAMPGVIDVATIRAVPHLGFGEDPSLLLGSDPNAIVIMAETFGHALAAEQAVRATWNPGTADGLSDDDVRQRLRDATIPLIAPPIGQLTVDGEFDFAHVAHAPLETMSAVADVKDGSAEIWSGLKIPIPAQQEIAEALGLPIDQVTVHVIPAGGSFGRRLFHEAALEAALASRAFGRPVKLMWSRAQDTKHDRLRPATHHKIRAVHLLGNVLSFEHRFTSGYTSFSHGFGDALTSVAAHDPLANYVIAQSIFALMITAPYNLGLTTQTLNEVDFKINTGSWRSVYTGTGRTAEEIMIDEIAAKLGKDPVAFRLATLKEEAAKRCLKWVADQGRWGKSMPAGTAQGIAVNTEHRSAVACLVELDARDRSKPRVTKATMAFDAGLPINPSGLEAQMLGGLNDGIATILQAGIHLDNGAVRETSFADYQYTRQGEFPPDVRLHVFPAAGDGAEPGGAGETSVAAAAGAIANAYARATGTKPRSFPINH